MASQASDYSPLKKEYVSIFKKVKFFYHDFNAVLTHREGTDFLKKVINSFAKRLRACGPIGGQLIDIIF